MSLMTYIWLSILNIILATYNLYNDYTIAEVSAKATFLSGLVLQ